MGWPMNLRNRLKTKGATVKFIHFTQNKEAQYEASLFALKY
jgi:hypothetical protein